MAGMMRDRHLGFVHYKEINPPTLPRISGRYLDRWVRIWEDAYKKGTPFELSARDLGEFWLLDQFFTVGIRGYVQSKAGIWLSEGPVSYLESAVFLASRARHPDHIHNLDVRREMIFRNLREWLRGWPADAMQQLGKRAAIYRADLADSLFDVALFAVPVYARSTFPLLRQEVQTYIFLFPFSVFMRTDFTFAFHILLDLL